MAADLISQMGEVSEEDLSQEDIDQMYTAMESVSEFLGAIAAEM